MNPGNAAKRAMQAKRREGIRQAVEAAGHTGLTMTDLGTLGLNHHTLIKDLCDMQQAGVLMRYVEARESHYVTDLSAIVAAKARKKARDKITSAACKARNKPAPKLVQPKRVALPKITPCQMFTAAEADYSRATLTRIPTPPDRWAPDAVVQQYRQAMQALRSA
jgi:hypothetical protein